MFQGHSSFVTHIDWDQNNEIIRSNSGDYEVLYCMLAYLFIDLLNSVHNS